uniref:Uncharacterized protein n=1 Tax=Chlamydomonas leiostraca TaxID=1034604 RepID=A0A7S0RBW6_9CHLO
MQPFLPLLPLCWLIPSLHPGPSTSPNCPQLTKITSLLALANHGFKKLQQQRFLDSGFTLQSLQHSSLPLMLQHLGHKMMSLVISTPSSPRTYSGLLQIGLCLE